MAAPRSRCRACAAPTRAATACRRFRRCSLLADGSTAMATMAVASEAENRQRPLGLLGLVLGLDGGAWVLWAVAGPPRLPAELPTADACRAPCGARTCRSACWPTCLRQPP